MAEFYDTRQDLLDTFISENPSFNTWDSRLLYSTLVRGNPGLSEVVKEGAEPDFYTSDEVLSFLRERNPELAEGLSDHEFSLRLKEASPDFAEVWGLGELHEPLEERDPEEAVYDGWIGRRLEKPLSEYEDGQKLLELQRPQAESWFGRFWETFKGRGGRDWVPYGSEVMDSVELVGIANSYRKLLTEGTDENLSDEELLKLNLYVERMTRETEAGGWGMAGSSLRQSLLFMTEFGVYMAGTALAAANVFTGPADDAALHTSALGYAGKKAANKKLRSWLSRTLLSDSALDVLETRAMKVGATQGGKLVKRAYVGRAVRDGMKDTLTERFHRSLFRGAETKLARGASRFLGTQSVNLGDALIKSAGKELAVGGATLAATGEFQTRRSLQMSMSDMLETGVPDDGDYRIAAYFDSVIEDYSEFLGDEILAALGGGVRMAGDKFGAARLAGDTSRKIGEKLRKLAQNGAKTAEEARTVQQRMAKAILDMHAAGKFGGLRSAHDMLKDAGYHGVFGEFMEERVGDMIRGLTGLEGEEDMNAFLRALDVGWNKTPDEWLAEAVTLITPMAASSAVRGGAQKLVEHSKGYEAVTRALGDLTGDEALHRSRRSDVRLLPVTPKTKEEAEKTSKYKSDWLDNLSSIEEIAKQESSGEELEARLASIKAMREQVESGSQDGYVLAQVRAGRDISTDGGPVSVEGSTLVLRPAPPISEEQRQESLRTGETDLASNAAVARQALELAHIAREKQSRSQGIVLDAVNGILDWAAGVKFMFAENRTFGTGAGVELTASEFEARQGAVDIVGRGQLAFERALADTPGFAKLRGRRSSELTDKEAQAYEDAVARAAAVAADQVMPMLNSYSGKVQLHAALTSAGWGDLVSQAGLDPKSLRSQVKARKMEKKVSELLANGVANGTIIRLPGGRMTLAPESKQKFLDELGVSGPEMSKERSLAEGLLEWRGITTRVVNAKEQAKLGESMIPGAMRAAGINLPEGARVSRGNAPIFSGLIEEALAKARKAKDTTRINILLGAQQMLHSYSRAYGVDVGFSIAELEQAKQPPSDQDTLAVRLVRQILNPNPQAPGFQQVMEDLGFPKTIGGERAFIEYAKRLGEILTKQLDGTLVAEGSLVVPAEDVDNDAAQPRVVTQLHPGGRFSIAEMDQNTGEAKVVVDSEGNPSVGEGGRVRYVGEEIASKGSYVRRVPRRVVFTRAPAFVFGTMKQMRAIGVQPGDLSDMKPYKKGATSESDVHVVKLDGQASFDGKTLFLTYNEAAVAEEILESASKQKSPKLVVAVDGVDGFLVHRSFRAAVDEARDRLRGQRRLSPAERRLLNAIDAKNPETQARNIFELQGKAAKYQALGFNESVDRLGKKDADVFREEAETLVELTRDESGESPLLKDLVSFYQEALGGAEALDILRYRAGATVATPAEERGKKEAAPKKPAPKKLSALQKAEAELDAAIQSGDVARVAEANKKRRKAMRDAGMSDTSSTRTTAYERQMREEIRLANLAYQVAKSGGDQKQMRAASKLREQLQASLRKVTELYKVSKSRNAIQYAAAKRTGYGTGQYEITRAAVAEMLLPELQRSGVLTEAEAKSLTSRDSGYEATRTKLSEFFSRPFKYLTIGKMEGESLEVSEAMIDQLFGPLQYADGQLPPLPAPIGDRTGMTDEQLAAADQEFERATLMYDLSQANEVNQALDGDAREAESTSRLHEQIGRAILAERMGPYFAMHLDRMRTEGNVSGGRAFGLPLAQAGGAQNIAEAAKKSDALAAESPIYNETNWKKFQEADVSGWESWEKDFHDVAKRLPLRVARMLWPSWFGRQFQELLLADMHNVSYEIGPDGRVFDAKMLGSVSPVTGLPDGQAGMVIGTLQVHVANKVRTREGLSAFTTALGHLCGNYTRALPSGRVNKSQFMQWLERPESAANIQMPTSPWARYKDGSVIKTPASGGKDEATSLARSFKFLGNLIKAAYAEQGLSRFVPWAGATRAERIALIEGSDWLKDVVDRAAKGEKLSASEIANAAAEYDKVMRAAEAAAFFLKDLYIALVGISTKVGRGTSYDYELARSTVYSAISSARVRVSDKQEDARDVVHENNAGIALAHLGSLVKESSRSTGLGSKPLVLNQRQMEFFNIAEAARAAGILRKGPNTGVALIDMKADAFKGSLSITRPDGSVDGYGRATPLDKRGNRQPRKGFHEGPDDQTPQMQYIAMLMTTRFGRRGEGGFYAYPLPMGDKKRQPALLLDADRVEAEARKIVAEEFPDLATSKGALRLDALFTAMDRMVAPLLSMEGSLGAESKKLTTSLKAMVKRLRLLSTSGDLLPITENGMKSTYDVLVAEEIHLEQVGKDGKLVRTMIPGDPFDGGAGTTAKMLLELDDSRGRLPGETHSAKLQETGSALYKGNATSGEAAMRTEAILKSLKLGGINPLFAGLTELAEKSGSRMWTTPGAEKAYNKAEGFWPAVREARTEVTLPDGTKATLVVSGRTVTHWTQSTLEVANLVRQAAPSPKDTTVSVPYNVSQGFEEQRARAKTLFELNELQARIAAGLYSTDDALAKATERAKSRDDYIGGMLDRGMSIRDPHALADVTPSLLSSAGSIFYTSAPTITAQLVPSGETLGVVAGGYRSPFLAPPGEEDGRTTAGLAMVNNVDPRARYLWQVAESDLEAVKAAIVQLARDPANTEANAVLQEKVRDYFGQKTTGREAVDDLVLDDFSFDEDAVVRTINGKTYIAGTGGIGYRIPGGKDGMAAGFFRLSLPATLDFDADGRVVPGTENYAMISGRSAGQRGEDFDGDMFYFKIAQREAATLDELATEYAEATEAKDDKALAVLEKRISRAMNAEHVRALRGMTLAQATAIIDKTVLDRVVATDGRTVGEHSEVGVTFDPKQPYLRGGRGLAAVGAKDDAQLKGVAVSAADAVSVLSLYEVLRKFEHEDLDTYFQRLNILQRLFSNVVNIALDVVNEPRAEALHLTPKTLPLFVAFMVSQKIDPAAEMDPAKQGDPKAKGTVAWAAQRWLELAESVDMGAYEAFAENLPRFEMDNLLGEQTEASFVETMTKVAARMLEVGRKIKEQGQPIDLAKWNKPVSKENLRRIWGIARFASNIHRRGRISKIADRGFSTVFDVMAMRKDLESERKAREGFETDPPFLRAQAAVDTAIHTLRAAYGDNTMDMILALDPKSRRLFDTAVDELLSDKAAKAVEAAYAEGLESLRVAPEWRSRAAQAVVEKIISDPRMADSDFANSISAEPGRKGQPRIKYVAPRTPPAIAQKAADEFFGRVASLGLIEIEVDGKSVSVPAEMVPALIALQQIEEHGVGPARFKGGIYHFLPATFQAEVAKQFEGAEETAPAEAPTEAPPVEAPTGLTYSEFLARLPKAIRKQMQRSLDAMGPDIAAMMGAERLSPDRIKEELQIARNIADEMDDAEAGLLLGALETELLGARKAQTPRGRVARVVAPRQIPGVADSGPGTKKGTGADQMMRDATLAAKVSAGVFVARGPELLRSSRTSAFTIAAKLGENVRSIGGSAYVVSPVGADFASTGRRYAPGEAVAMIAGNTGTRLTDEAKAAIQRLNDAGFEFVVGSMPEHTDSDAREFILSIGGKVTVYDWDNRYKVPTETVEQEEGVKYPVSDLFEALGGRAGRLVTDYGLYGTEVLGDSAADGRRIANELVDATEMSDEEKAVVKTAIARATPTGWETSATRDIPIEAQILETSSTRFDLEGALDPLARSMQRAEELKKLHVERLSALSMPSHWGGRNDLAYGKAADGSWQVFQSKIDAEGNQEVDEDTAAPITEAEVKAAWAEELKARMAAFEVGNRDFAAIAESVEQWKREQGIVYDPKDAHAVGEAFYHDVGAFNREAPGLLGKIASVLLAQQRKLRRGERDWWKDTENQLVVSGYTARAPNGPEISKWRVSILKPIGGLEASHEDFATEKEARTLANRLASEQRPHKVFKLVLKPGAVRPGRGMRFVVNPSSRDIVWAAVGDVYSGTVSDKTVKQDDSFTVGSDLYAATDVPSLPGTDSGYKMFTKNGVEISQNDYLAAANSVGYHRVQVDPKAPSADKLGLLADSVATAIQGRRPQNYNEIGVRLRLGNFYIEGYAGKRTGTPARISGPEGFNKWGIVTNIGEFYSADEGTVTNSGLLEFDSEAAAKAWLSPGLPAELRRLNELLKKAYMIVHGSLDPMAMKRKSYDTSATRQAILDNGRETLYPLAYELTPRRNDAGAADRIRNRMLRELDAGNAASRRAARAQVLDNIRIASRKNPRFQYDGAIGPIREFVRQLEQADSVLAGTTTEAPAPKAAPAATQMTLPGVDTSATRELSERRKIFDDMGLKPGLDYTADPGEIVGASEQTPLMATETLRYHRALEAEGVPVRTFLEDPAAARMVAAFDGHDAPPAVAASLSTFIFDRDYRRAERALELSDLPERLKERVSGAIRDAKEAQDTGHKNTFEIGYDPETQPLDIRIDPIGEDDFDFRANELTSSTRTIDAIIRDRIAFMIEYGGSQRAHQILRDTAYYVNAERKLLSNFNLRMRSIFFEDAGITHFIRSIDSKDVDPDTGLHKKEYLRGLRNRIMHHTTRVELSVQDRNMLTRLFAAIDAMIEGDEFAVYGGKIRRIDDPTTGEQGKFAPQVATRLDQDGAPIGEIEPVEKILSDFETSGLREKYLANGRTEVDLDIRALAETIKKYYSDMRTRLNSQAFALLGREYLDEVVNYVPHQYGGRGFEDSFQRAAWRAVSWQAENIGRRTGSRASLPPLAFDASKKSFKHDILPEQVELVKKLAAERDNLMSEALGRPVRQAARALERLAGADLRGANRVILQLVREVESIKAEQAERKAGEGVESAYKMAPETADLISGLSHASRNYAVKEWTERAEERVYDSYFQAYMESEGLLARRSMDPFTRLRRYVDDVTSAMSQQMITQIFSLAPVQTEDGFTPAVIAVPDMARLSEMPSNRRVVSESVAKAQVAFISMEQNIKDVPGETAFHQLKWLIDNGYLKSKDYVEVQSPYASTEKFLVIKGRPRQLLLKHLAVDPQLIFRLTPGGVQHDAVKLVTNITQFTKHAAVSWSMFFVFAGVEAVIALGGLSKHNIVAKAPSALKQLRDLRRDVRRGDAALDDVIYRMHRAGIDMSEHAVSDGSVTIVENMSKRVSENFARWVGKPELAAQAKPALDFMTGRWASKKIMGDFFPLVKFWGGLEIIEGMRREAPGVPLDTIYRKAAPNVNNAFGGQMFVDYPGMTPFWTKFLNMGMFAVNWCVPLDSQALTKTGWKNHDELSVGDEILIYDNKTRSTRWGPVRDKYMNLDYRGDMVHIKNYQRDIRMTPEHTCVVDSRSGSRIVKKAMELSVNDCLPRCAQYAEAPGEESVSDRLVVLAGWLVTDGYVKRKHHRRSSGEDKEYRYGRIGQSKPATVELLKSLGLKFYSRAKKDTNFKCNFDPHTFLIPVKEYRELEALGLLDGKLSWGFISKLTKRQLQLLADTMLLGDGTGQNRFCGEESEVFWATLINTLLGKPVTFWEQTTAGQRCWLMRTISTESVSCHKKHTAPYKGGIWCPSVDTGFWVTQQDGAVFITGNTVSAWNIAGGQKLTGHRFGNYLSLEGERFVFMRNWPAMYFLVLLALPNVLQLGINAVARAAGGGDDEDELFASMNEAGKGGLFPSIDVTPIMRELPGYTGGHTGERRVYIRFGKQSYEVLNGWLENPKRTFLRKTSMPFKLIWEQTFESSPGSPEFSLPFKDMGFAGLFSSRVDGNPFLKLWNSRVGFAAQKFLPLSWNTLVQGDMESWAFIGTAPMSKGMAQTRAIPPMARLLETYAETESFGRLKTSAAARANLERMTWSYLRALERNGYDPDSILVSAKGLVMRKYYQDFFDGMARNDQATMDKAAKALIRLNGTARNLGASVASRYKKKYKTKLSPDQRAALMDAFEGLRVPFQKGPPE